MTFLKIDGGWVLVFHIFSLVPSSWIKKKHFWLWTFPLEVEEKFAVYEFRIFPRKRCLKTSKCLSEKKLDRLILRPEQSFNIYIRAVGTIPWILHRVVINCFYRILESAMKNIARNKEEKMIVTQTTQVTCWFLHWERNRGTSYKMQPKRYYFWI